MGVVVAVTSMEVTQTWNPPAMDTVVAGDVIERTITRRATGTTAMMLPPVSFDATEGVRLYSADPILEDHIERGASSAERRDRIKYQFERPGTFQLPSVSLVWWDPQAEKLQQETLPGATINVAGTIEAAATAELPSSRSSPCNSCPDFPDDTRGRLVVVQACAKTLEEMASTPPGSRGRGRATVAVRMPSQ